MRLVRFLKRAFLDGSLYEPGDEALVGDNHFGAHLVDVASGQPDPVLPAEAPHAPVFLDHSKDRVGLPESPPPVQVDPPKD